RDGVEIYEFVSPTHYLEAAAPFRDFNTIQMPHSVEKPPIRDRYSAKPLTVMTDPPSSNTIYNGELKAIVSAAGLQTVLVCRPSSGITIYPCEGGARRGRLEIFRAGAERGTPRVPVPYPPTCCLALLALSPAAKSELEVLRKTWSGGTEGFLPEVTF